MSNRYRPLCRNSVGCATSGVSATSDKDVTAVVAPASLTVVAPASPEPTYRTCPKNLPKNTRDKSHVDRFDEFWAAYPRKEGSKAKTKASWVRQKLDGQADQIIAAVADRALNDIGWEQRQFIPHALTYRSEEHTYELQALLRN